MVPVQEPRLLTLFINDTFFENGWKENNLITVPRKEAALSLRKSRAHEVWPFLVSSLEDCVSDPSYWRGLLSIHFDVLDHKWSGA